MPVIPRKAVHLLAYALSLLVGLALLQGLTGSRLEGSAASCQLQVLSDSGEGTSPLTQAQQVSQCLDSSNSWLGRWRMRDTREALAALPNAPCRYLGVWVSLRGRSAYSITLKGDGEFTAEPLAESNQQERYSGVWGVHEGKMVWLPRSRRGAMWPPDINPIRDPKAESFSLEEQDGKLSHFFLVKSLYAANCSA